MAADFEPDFVILDIGMPGLNGYEAFRRIRENSFGKKAVMIALSGWGQEDEGGDRKKPVLTITSSSRSIPRLLSVCCRN